MTFSSSLVHIIETYVHNEMEYCQRHLQIQPDLKTFPAETILANDLYMDIYNISISFYKSGSIQSNNNEEGKLQGELFLASRFEPFFSLNTTTASRSSINEGSPPVQIVCFIALR